ncbi:MAG: hypothetical protein M1830_007091 [Pleopsidium flavum]|nr:MAG: hypothetical protein M1830_007091 [Pleopsidium flavum]
MEAGGLHDDASSASSNSSSELDRQKMQSVFGNKFAIIHTAIVVLFLMMVLVAFLVSRNFDAGNAVKLLSNGTASFAPTTILISLDGFRADFLHRGLTPTLNSLIAEGISPEYMLPSFPSVTFPNHYTLVTGLYPESHGVVGNTFWDPDMEEEFSNTDPVSMEPKWWQAEPVWNTAEKAGVRSAIHMWPGSEALIGGITPAFLDNFNATEVLSRKVDRILELLDMPGSNDRGSLPLEEQRPQFIAAYVPVVDADGHKYGPNSTEIRTTIMKVDDMLHDLFAGLAQRNLTQVVNVVVVSDHGMASTSVNRMIQLDDLIDLNLVEHIDGWPLYGLRPKNPIDLRGLYDRLTVESARNPNFEVYLRDEDMPERYHFSNNDRIAPLWIIPKTGWAIVKKAEFDIEHAKRTGEVYHPRGLHGYDHQHQLMRAIFVARGPAFPHRPNNRVDVFQNIEVYNIICDSLQIPPQPNNGTLRLPLKPIGLHSDMNSPQDGTLPDPPIEMGDEKPSTETTPVTTTTGVGMEITRPVVHDGNSPNANGKGKKENSGAWWAYVMAKVEVAKGWASAVLAKFKGNHSLDDGR